MFNIENVKQVLVVANFLRNTGRWFHALKICSECSVFFYNGTLKDGEPRDDSLEDIVDWMILWYNKYNWETSETRSLTIQGDSLYYVGHYHEAITYYRKALAIAIEIGVRNWEAAIYGNLGNAFYGLSDYDQAKIYHNKALAIRKEIGDKVGEANDYANLGGVFLSRGEFVKAEQLFERALEIRMEISDRKGEALCYQDLGTVFFKQSENARAEKYVEEALMIQIEIGDRRGEASSYLALGTMSVAVSKYTKAKEYLEKALAIQKEIKDKSGEASSLEGLGKTLYAGTAEYVKAMQYHEKALMIRIEIGNRAGEASSYGELGNVFQSRGEYAKAKEYYEKALAITQEIGDKLGEAAAYGNLGAHFLSLGKYVEAQEYHEKSLAISKEIGFRKGEADAYGNLGSLFQSLDESVKAKEYYEKAITIEMEIGDRAGEATVYGYLGVMFQSLGENIRAKECYGKALVIRKEIGDKNGEAESYQKLGTIFLILGEHTEAQNYYDKSFGIYKEIGNREGEATSYRGFGIVCLVRGEYVMAEKYLENALFIANDIGDDQFQLILLCNLAWVKLLQKKFQDARSFLVQGITKSEELRHFLAGNDEFNISFSDQCVFPYRLLCQLFCAAANPNKALYVVELGRARGLADLMTTKYSVKVAVSANPESWIGMENIMKKESDCTCLYISYNYQELLLWVIKTSGVIHFRRVKLNEDIAHDGQIKDLDDFFSTSFRSFGILSEEECEDRSLQDLQPNMKSSIEKGLAALRLVEEDDDEESQEPEPSPSLYYKMLIAPVADFLEDREVIIVPDRSLYRVPFAALQDRSGKYLSETYRIRIIPSLTTLKLIQDSPADYHSQTGALIVGDPNVCHVMYKGHPEDLSRLPCAGKEAAMIGRLLGVEPLLGEHATKQAVLQRIHSVSLIHFAAHGNAERGEIALAPEGSSSGIAEEED